MNLISDTLSAATPSNNMAGSNTGHLWLRGYACPPGEGYDEMFAHPGVLREHWCSFVKSVEGMGLAELARRWEAGRRLIHENGVTYNVYGDPKGMDRPWELDAIPLLLSQAEWTPLEAALIQRARLLNLILQDLYGPQKLMREGLLPPELIFNHPGFLRACHGINLPHQCHLHLYSADIGRLPDGRWAVLADRSQAPSGAGYALENRIVVHRTLSNVFDECQVQRLATFFRTVRETLASLAPFNRDNPRIVLLTPGPLNETYFEHAYLARYLNYTLVEGNDLTVRDQCVYLKTLGGLHRVDVILRRLDDHLCDPLELRTDSDFGVTGLVQAARTGGVALANALGSGLVETPAMIPYLPMLCRHLLNEDLKIPSVETHWCGEPQGLQHVLANLHKMVIKPTYPSRSIEPVFAALLSDEKRAELAEKMRARPRAYVGQLQVPLSTAPVMLGDALQPRHAVLRTFLVATENSYSVMPGGLTQIPNSADKLVFSLQRGGGSKDTWVPSSGPVSTFSLLLPPGAPIEISRGGGDLPSRVADDLFWLGRYVERAESGVRLLRAIMLRITGRSRQSEVPELPCLIHALQHLRGVSLGKGNGETTAISSSPDQHLSVVLEELRRPRSLYSTMSSLNNIARLIRDRLSTDTWRVLISLNENLVHAVDDDAVDPVKLLAWTNHMVINLASFGGLASESMTRGQVWRFLDMGRRLERGTNIISLLSSTLASQAENETATLEAVLEVADSFMTYRRRYLSSLQAAPVVDLLLADESNPRSLAFQLAALVEHADNLPRNALLTQGARLSPEQRLAMGALLSVRLVEVEDVVAVDEHGKRVKLLELLTALGKSLPALSASITRHYLTHAQQSRQLSNVVPNAD